MKNRLLFLILVIGMLSCAPKSAEEIHEPVSRQMPDSLINYLHGLKDLRKTSELIPYLSHENPSVRYESALCLASVGDTFAAKTLIELFGSEKDTMAQRAMGLAIYHSCDGKKTEILFPLIDRSLKENNQIQICRSIGKCSETDDSTVITQKLASTSPMAKMVCAYEMALRKKFSLKLIEQAIQILESESNQGACRWAANYLNRLQRTDFNDWPKYQESLKDVILLQTDDEIKRVLVVTVKKFSKPLKQELIQALLTSETNPAVLIEIIRSVEADGNTPINNRILDLCNHSSPNLTNTAAAHFLDFGSEEMAAQLLEKSKNTDHWRTTTFLLGSTYKFGIGGVALSAFNALNELIQQTANYYQSAEAVKMLAAKPSNNSLLLEIYETDPNLLVKEAAMESMKQTVAFPFSAKAIKQIVEACIGENASLAAIAALKIRDEELAEFIDSETVALIAKRFGEWQLPQFFETKMELGKTLRYLEKTVVNEFAQVNPYNHPPDWIQIENCKGKTLLFVTEKGNFTMNLDFVNAPISAGYIAQLASDGFYNGLTFHRVVANFVAQGGCQVGDGFGATPLSLRSEFGFSRYQRGSVGLASSGKDTESCQLFICHNPCPHLTGRYTIIGKIVDGMEIVDQIEVSDVIVSVTIQ